jgi:hypothetical protein
MALHRGGTTGLRPRAETRTPVNDNALPLLNRTSTLLRCYYITCLGRE